jgi:predicted nucleotide-binding protein (sugar kinase/HSP70/actin superfamily)
VIKVRTEKDLGTKIIVQGGTFYNDAVLRCFELITGREAIRPDIAGIMGAYGAALIAKESYVEGEETTLLSGEALAKFSIQSTNRRCDKCTNHCLLTINTFSDGESFIAGNRCERGAGIDQTISEQLPNLYDFKYHRTFDYEPLPIEKAYRGVIGIPRVLNQFENYPFWFTLFTSLGFRVIISNPTSKKLYEKGLETIPSESACYPAKLCHGHIINLVERGIDRIFYPSVVYEKKEYQEASNHYNCPIVISYSEVVRSNIDELKERNIRFINPFLSLDNTEKLTDRMFEEFESCDITKGEMIKAIQVANEERERYKKDIQNKGEETLAFLRENNKKGIVLCGKPYHVDPEINHGIAKLIQSYGMAVLTEDSIAHLSPLRQKLRVVDQWVYNSRLYRAASLVVEEPCLELIQLNSFGCGLDAVTSDQIAEILTDGGKLYTMLKIDEGNNLGAAKIRVRSLKAAMEERDKLDRHILPMVEQESRPIFTKKMKWEHTILAPQMAPIHFELVQTAARACGYQMEVLPANDKTAVDEGLKYVNNDACYPAILMIGQLVQALKSGKYDVNNTSVIITQSGGGCRATNYIAFLKLGLKQAGFPEVPVISLNTLGLDKQPGFKLSPGLINRCIMALVYGDLFMRLINHTRPYECFPGSAQLLYEKWMEKAKRNLIRGGKGEFHGNIRRSIKEFDCLEVVNTAKPRVGVVGEILLKYHPTANNDIVTIIEQGGAEAVVPDLMDYFLYSTYNARFRYQYLAGTKLNRSMSNFARAYLERYRSVMFTELAKSKRFLAPTPIDELAHMASSVLSLGNQTGEGWLVTAEMMEFLEQGTHNILCVQPMACLPNHITGKGMIKPLKDRFPQANIMPIDYDPGISSVNQLNRIKLMLSVALKEFATEER